MKLIVTMFPTDLVANKLLPSLLPFLPNQKQESGFQQDGSLVTRNISAFYL